MIRTATIVMLFAATFSIPSDPIVYEASAQNHTKVVQVEVHQPTLDDIQAEIPAPEPPEQAYTQNGGATHILPLLDAYSAKYGIYVGTLYDIIECETAHTFDPYIQSGHYIDGVRENSHGLAQINLTIHSDITYEQATDPDYAIEFLARNLSEGRTWMWACYDILYGDTM